MLSLIHNLNDKILPSKRHMHSSSHHIIHQYTLHIFYHMLITFTPSFLLGLTTSSSLRRGDVTG